MIDLFKEVRNLSRLGMNLAVPFKLAASEAKERYPYAMRLNEVLRIYTRTSQSGGSS